MLADNGGSLEDSMFAKQESNPQMADSHRLFDEKCTGAQKDFFFEHGKGMNFEEMRQVETAQMENIRPLQL